ncbi:MAG: nitroreductase family protein [Candidatus Bathyarchaeia archaeon]|jgi:nitroreductase
MDSVIEAINSRKSTRSFEAKPVSKDILNTIIEAGNHAPFTSMTRAQPWRFVVAQEPEFKQKLFQTAFPIWKQSIDAMKDASPELYKMAMTLHDALDDPKDVVYYSAPVILFVIGPQDNAVSCALACENVMIAAQALGLGSCYVGFGSMVKGNTDVVAALELKENEQIYGPILLGYPKENLSEAIRNALESIGPQKKSPVTKWI